MNTTSERMTPPMVGARAGFTRHRGRPHATDAESILDALSERVVRYRIDDLTITYCNEAWRALYGVDSDAVLGRQLDGFLSADAFVGLRHQLGLLGPDNPVVTDSIARSSLNDPDLWH